MSIENFTECGVVVISGDKLQVRSCRKSVSTYDVTLTNKDVTISLIVDCKNFGRELLLGEDNINIKQIATKWGYVKVGDSTSFEFHEELVEAIKSVSHMITKAACVIGEKQQEESIPA